MPRRNKNIKYIRKTKPTIGCSAKRRYPSEREAKAAAEYQTLIKPDLELSVYQCDLCYKWHLTRQCHTHAN